MGKSASFNPADLGSGGAVPDGRYTIKAAQCSEFDYGGTAQAVPSAEFVFNDGATDYTQHYSAGKLENLIPNDDGTEFVHPNGQDAIINKKSNFGVFLKAIADAGFPTSDMTSKITCFVGADIEIVNQAQEKRPGLKDQAEGKTIPLPTKYYGKAKKGARPTTSRAATAGSKAASTASAQQHSTDNGDATDAAAVERIQTALAEAPDNTLSVVKLATTVWLTAQKDKDANVKLNALNYKKRAGDPSWLQEHEEEGGWTIEGNNVSIA